MERALDRLPNTGLVPALLIVSLWDLEEGIPFHSAVLSLEVRGDYRFYSELSYLLFCGTEFQ